MPITRLRSAAISLAIAQHLLGCKVYDPLYCGKESDCSDPSRPFCDLQGEYPGSEGVPRTCIPSPFDAGPGAETDAGGGGSDGGSQNVDGAPERRVVQLALGKNRTCAVLDDGGLRCWGSNADGVLGYPVDIDAVGDDEHPFEVGDVPTGGPVKDVALGADLTCILYAAGNVRCFGNNGDGLLGYGHTDPLSGPPSEIPDVSLGEPAKMITAGLYHVCAVLESGSVRCWGTSGFSALGYGDGEQTVGDDEEPSDKPPINVGSGVSYITAGILHTCAILGGADGRVRCWGMGLLGVLGYGNTQTIGDDEPPSSAGDVTVGGAAVGLQAYEEGNCVLLDSGGARCWGDGVYGDSEPAYVAPLLQLGGVPSAVSGGPRCALTSDGSVRCWGENESGQLGLGHTDRVNQSGILKAGPANLAGVAQGLARGFVGENDAHMCALLENGGVRCWGDNTTGQLGLGHRENVGDDEVPADVPAVRVLE